MTKSFLSKILPTILSVFTGPRYYEKEHFISGSWSSNVFIAFRKVFWRKYGLQRQMTSNSSGEVYFYTKEAFLVHHESLVRQWIKSKVPKMRLVKIYLPTLAMPYNISYKTPYIFAIALDTTTSTHTTAATSSAVTFAHTCVSGSVLVTGWNNDNTNTLPTSPSYNGAALTVGVDNSTGRGNSMHYITNPTTGSSLTVSFTPQALSWAEAGATSWTGANTSSLIGTTATGTNTNSSISLTATTTVDNSYLMENHYLNDRSRTTTPDAPSTLNWSEDTGVSEGTRGESAYRTTTTAGSYTLSWTIGGGTSLWFACMVEIKPAAGAVSVSAARLLSLMGVGN